MNSPPRALRGMIVIIISACASFAWADQPVKNETKDKPANPPQAKADKADAAAPKQEKKAVEPLNVEAVAAPIRRLFLPADAGAANNAANNAQQQAQIDALAAQHVEQLRSIMTSELEFVRLMCGDLTLPQRRTIKEQADAALKEAGIRLANQQMGRVAQPANGQQTPTNPRKQIRDAIAKSLQECLSEQRQAEFVEAANRRSEDRKDAAVLGLVSRLDHFLYLSADQRDEISKTVITQSKDDWEQWLTMFQVYGSQYFPTGLEKYVNKHLTGQQQEVWQRLQKIDIGWWNHQQMNGLNDDGWWGNDVAQEAAPAAINIRVGR